MFFRLISPFFIFSLSLLLVIFARSAFSQTDHFTATLSPGITMLAINDPDSRPSSESIIADGETRKVENLPAYSFKLNATLLLGQNIYFSPGFWIINKRMRVSNRDADYFGQSDYRTSYIQLPFLFKYLSDNFKGRWRGYMFVGPSIDFKIREQLEGSDGAHYWNLSRNRTDLDPVRGRNGDNEPEGLFNPFDISLHIAAGVVYDFSDKFAITAGVSYGISFYNMINPDLKFNDVQQTPVQDSVDWKTSTLLIDIGILIKMDN